ncbi:MAG: hypothetical protein ABW009_15460, partial [Acidimicrobiales bacterium]
GEMVVARFTADGQLDTTFSGNGWFNRNLSPQDDLGNGVALDAEGRAVVVGSLADQQKLALLRLQGDPL